MCTLIILRRPGSDWPLIIGANRDEMANRPWAPPSRHWPDRPEVVAGLDREAGGTWLGVNDHGVVAGVLNRVGSLGPAQGKRSRGELVLEAIDHADAADAAGALSDLDAGAYRSFNLVVADNRDAFWLRGRGQGWVERLAIPEGLSMLTAHELNDSASPRIRRYLDWFRSIPAPDPGRDQWDGWKSLMASRDHDPGDGPTGAMTIITESGFGTLSSSLIALPAPALGPRPPVWLFAPGRPDATPFAAVDLRPKPALAPAAAQPSHA